MKVIIAGGRDFRPSQIDWITLDMMKDSLHPTEIVCGACKGADLFGADWAEENDIPVKYFNPDWSLGKIAGPIRNAQMAEYADAVLLFKGGRGTASMRKEAKKHGLQIREAIRY